MAAKKSQKKTPKTPRTARKQAQINAFFMAVVIFLLGLSFTLILIKANRIKRVATIARHANYVDEFGNFEDLTSEDKTRSLKHYFHMFEVTLPPIGPYAEAGHDALAVGAENTDFVENNIWIIGGNFEEVTKKGNAFTSPGQWDFIHYRLAGEFPAIPTGINLKTPGGTFLQTISDMEIGATKKIVGGNTTYTYTKKEPMIVHGQKIMLFDVKPTFQSGYIGRKDALFIRNGKTFYIIFDWKETRYTDSLEAILETINFDVPEPTKVPAMK